MIKKIIKKKIPAKKAPAKKAPVKSNGLRDHVAECIAAYFDRFEGEDLPSDIYGMVLEEFEAPVLAEVMKRTGGNKLRAAEVLGMNRATLRKKLNNYGIA